MAIKLNVKSVNIIWHVLPFQLRPDAVGATSPRSFGGIGRTVTCYVGYLVDRRKGKNVNVNVNLKCFSMLPEGEAYNRV